MNRAVRAIAAGLLCFWAVGAWAATIQTAGDGNWTNTATWTGGVIPGLDDQAAIKWSHDVDVSSDESVGSVYMVGRTVLNLGSGAVLTVDNSGAESGMVLLDDKTDSAVINISQWAQLNPKGFFRMNAGGAGVTNSFHISYGGLTTSGWSYWGEDGAGEALMEIGQKATIKLWGKENWMMANSILQFTFSSEGVSSAMQINRADGFLNIQPGADLVIDMSAMELEDVGAVGSEITLVDVVGAAASVTGTWDNVSFIGDSEVTSCYQLSYDGGAGADVVLEVVSNPSVADVEIGSISIEMIGSDAVVSWPGTNGVTYALQRKPDLTSTNAWSNVVTGVAGAGVLSATNAADASAAFYRVTLE